jgi:hypothetical protein
MKARGSNQSLKRVNERLEDFDPEYDDMAGEEWFGKSKVECICPGCGRVHIIKMHWIGRGVPRKFCQSCRDRETPREDGD